jgi:hypothetical protein
LKKRWPGNIRPNAIFNRLFFVFAPLREMGFLIQAAALAKV